MLKYGVTLEGKAGNDTQAGPYSTLTENGNGKAGDIAEADAML
jgi:hypothetical protein